MRNLFKRILLFISVFCINGLLYANPSLEKKPKLYAIVIGIGEYTKANFSSKIAKNDANTIYQKLKAQVGYTYTEGNIKLLNQPEQTSHTSIQQAFEDVKSKIKHTDTFVIFIAGEADRVDEEYYLLTSKTQDFSAKQLQSTGLSATQLKKLIANIPTAYKLILIDTPMSDSVMKMTDLFSTHNIKTCKSGMILTAGRYTIDEGFRGHSLFTYTLLDALSGIADTNKNSFIESNELAQYVEAAIPMIAKHDFNRRQTPYIDKCGDNLQFKKIQ
ncbi:hypothetical protein QE380_003079 [Acinetobacter baylyi]|uniref:Peptidase C14 caspase domain-containing protein n=1 Tax=Acinetobacter baylyi TaxID=202950 RepID=A0ABU0V044_ACIBI|nr:caspase family protein [Acinetobacter baylyi]MDQ1210156.1 hypothetical protein [Acinetobacter baylyi]MDR6106249.1 hypothetical protein [Acinetobacter baylyi]MDR6187025.1 hypothetical protein [Acinetobacter baylyi]